MFPHALEVAALEETGARSGFLKEMNARNPEHLSALLSQAQAPSKQGELPIDCTVGQSSSLARRDIRREARLIDGHQPLIIEARSDRLELDQYVSELPITRDTVMLN